MRTDPTKEITDEEIEAWEESDLTVYTIQKSKPEDGDGLPFRSIPFSGRERNRLFVNDGENFKDLTLVSGADFREDGRGFAWFDYDNDGFLDLAIANPNTPKLRIVRNRMPDVSQATAANSFVRVKPIGGHDSSEPTTEWSSRDAFGAIVLATTGDIKRVFQFSSSEGLSAQNSRFIHIGMADMDKIDTLEIKWPSGKKSVLKDVKSGQTIEVFENEDASK